MQDVFGSDRFFADAAFGKGEVFCYAGIEVMANHQHVHMLVERVDRVGSRGVCGRGEHVLLAHDFQNIGRMSAPCALCVEAVNRAAFECRNGVFHKS